MEGSATPAFEKPMENRKTTRLVFLDAAAMTTASYARVLGANDRVGI
jgi:hypothetical protein